MSHNIVVLSGSPRKEGNTERLAAFLMTCGDKSEKAAEGAVATYRNMLAYSKWQDAGVIIATGLHNPGEIEGRAELEKAKRLGAEI